MMLIKQRQLKTSIRESITGFAFIAPSFLGVLVFVILPVIYSLIISFTKWDIVSGFEGMKFIGLDNYKAIFRDDWFIASLKNNFLYTLFNVPITMVLALMLALVLNKKVFGTNIFRALFFMPHMTNISTVSIIWIAMLNPYGPISEVLGKIIGGDNVPNFLSNPNTALPSLIFIGIWIEMGYFMMFFLAGLQNIPKELYEASTVDGANWWQKFRNVTIPMLSPTTFFILITSLIFSFKVFGQVNIMTEGGPARSTSVLVYYIYETGFKFYNMGYASAMAWVLFLIIFLITYFQWRKQKKWVAY